MTDTAPIPNAHTTVRAAIVVLMFIVLASGELEIGERLNDRSSGEHAERC